MRRFSRWMPAAACRPLRPVGKLLLVCLLVGFVGVAITWPYRVAGVCGVAAAFNVVTTKVAHGRLRRLAAGRTGEDIGTFARGFDRRTEPFDPWVVRATWDALVPHVSYPGGRLPLRPRDTFVEDIRIDPELISIEFVEIAERSGRCLDGVEANPLYRNARTVSDLVRLVSAQPLTGSARRA